MKRENQRCSGRASQRCRAPSQGCKFNRFIFSGGPWRTQSNSACPGWRRRVLMPWSHLTVATLLEPTS
jgi:hypothetical protein